MDRIKLFYSNVDTKPRIIIHNFARYLGIYVEDIVKNTGESDEQSLFDIYIVSDAYVGENSDELDIKDENKTILIYMDGWGPQQLKEIRHIFYDELSDLNFLRELSFHINGIISESKNLSGRLICDTDNLGYLLDRLVKLYIDNNILQVTSFASCFYAESDLLKVACKKYVRFVSQIENLSESGLSGDLIKYIYIRSKYEADLICKINSCPLYYDPKLLEQECVELLIKYTDNEILHILQADINYILNGVWNKAGYQYLDVRLEKCAYAYFRQGEILQRYAKDKDGALWMYHMAVQKKADYYIAWFKMGECYEWKLKFRDAVNAYEQVCIILMDRYYEHVLAPLEILYLYGAVIKIAEINELNIKNYRLADDYWKLSMEIPDEIDEDRYFRLVCGENSEYEKYFPLVQASLAKKIKGFVINTSKERKLNYDYQWEKN